MKPSSPQYVRRPVSGWPSHSWAVLPKDTWSRRQSLAYLRPDPLQFQKEHPQTRDSPLVQHQADGPPSHILRDVVSHEAHLPLSPTTLVVVSQPLLAEL